MILVKFCKVPILREMSSHSTKNLMASNIFDFRLHVTSKPQYFTHKFWKRTKVRNWKFTADIKDFVYSPEENEILQTNGV